MALRVSIDGTKPILATNVVVYRDDVPVAIAVAIDDDNVMYVDGVRDPEFVDLLDTLGIPTDNLSVLGPTIKGDM